VRCIVNTRCMLHGACCALHVARCMLSVAWCTVQCCLVHVVRCMLHGAMLSVAFPHLAPARVDARGTEADRQRPSHSTDQRRERFSWKDPLFPAGVGPMQSPASGRCKARRLLPFARNSAVCIPNSRTRATWRTLSSRRARLRARRFGPSCCRTECRSIGVQAAASGGPVPCLQLVVLLEHGHPVRDELRTPTTATKQQSAVHKATRAQHRRG
jgi:hypothetical protein